ncbi:hypothetical protein J6590_047411 [Homalodisca vitripennis]|nr:hypothetical protein J6590_047411 [Homalodisca vitripennis]
MHALRHINDGITSISISDDRKSWIFLMKFLRKVGSSRPDACSYLFRAASDGHVTQCTSATPSDPVTSCAQLGCHGNEQTLPTTAWHGSAVLLDLWSYSRTGSYRVSSASRPAAEQAVTVFCPVVELQQNGQLTCFVRNWTCSTTGSYGVSSASGATPERVVTVFRPLVELQQNGQLPCFVTKELNKKATKTISPTVHAIN